MPAAAQASKTRPASKSLGSIHVAPRRVPRWLPTWSCIGLLLLTLAAPAFSDEWSTEKLREAREFSKTLDTAAVVVMQNGEVVDQWGAVALPLMCHSVRKSILSALYGSHVERGSVRLDATLAQLGIDDNEPSLTEAEREATLRDLLSARSGVYHPALYETKAMAAKRPPRGSHPPNTHWYYNNWDFNAAGTIFENLAGQSIYEAFEDQLAEPLCMQDFRRDRDTGYVTGDDSVHPAYPFRLSARDLAKFGQLMLQRGKWSGKQLIPKSWIEESTASYSDSGSSGGYGYMWWVAQEGRHFPGVSLPPGSYSARGYRGHYLVVIPEWNIVVCHRVNTFQTGTRVAKSEFGELLALILAARPETPSSQARTDRPAPSFDLIIRNGQIVDGSGKAAVGSDVGVLDGRIAAVGDLQGQRGAVEIDAKGKFVCPGFIDLHSHAEKGLVLRDPARRSAPNLITQGITTVVVNQDGGGPLDLAAQKQTMRRRGVGLNVIQTIGHGTIRKKVMGDNHQRPATDDEIAEMQSLIRQAMQGGAFGLSAGLEYVPGRWSTPQEMERLAATVAEHDGVYIVHERSSGSQPMWFLPSRDPGSQPSMLDNLRELLLIADRTKVTTVATHIKARGVDFWGSSEAMNAIIRQARDRGLAFYADQYPYNTSGSDGRIVLLPAWAFAKKNDQTFAWALRRVLSDKKQAGDLRRDIAHEISRRGGADHILIVEHPTTKLAGKSLAQYAAQLNVHEVEAAIQLQLKGDEQRRGGCRLRAFSMSEKDVEAFARTPWTATSSDAGIALPTDAPVHPRFYGAFPRKIHHYAMQRKVISVEEAIRVATSLPAKILQLPDRGLIKAGCAADLVVFDPQRIRDRADAFHPHRYSEGIECVLVNGRIAVANEQWIGCLAGEVIEKAIPELP